MYAYVAVCFVDPNATTTPPASAASRAENRESWAVRGGRWISLS